MSSIQTMRQMPTGQTARGWDPTGGEVDVCILLDKADNGAEPVAKPPRKRNSMSMAVIKSIRVALRGIPDGMTLEELSDLLARPKTNVRKVLKNMPDTYIDRWEVAPRGQYKAVWCIVVPPNDCPRPDGVSNEND